MRKCNASRQAGIRAQNSKAKKDARQRKWEARKQQQVPLNPYYSNYTPPVRTGLDHQKYEEYLKKLNTNPESLVLRFKTVCNYWDRNSDVCSKETCSKTPDSYWARNEYDTQYEYCKACNVRCVHGCRVAIKN
ncbi:MAG: hypothetical protein FWF97_03225 [Alphaproteobacteria bacterium]|nr:hypothetical protein [Alphaproteobacteria bacterium]